MYVCIRTSYIQTVCALHENPMNSKINIPHLYSPKEKFRPQFKGRNLFKYNRLVKQKYANKLKY